MSPDQQVRLGAKAKTAAGRWAAVKTSSSIMGALARPDKLTDKLAVQARQRRTGWSLALEHVSGFPFRWFQRPASVGQRRV